MKGLSIIQVIFCLIILRIGGFNEFFAQDEGNLWNGEISAIDNTIRSSIGWAKTKDFILLYSVISNDSSYLEVHPGDRVVKGFDEFKKGEEFWGSADFTAIGYDIRDLRITLSQSGEVAWFYCILDDINEWKGQPANWLNTRWTGVLEKLKGKWVIRQMHFSFASVN